MESKNLLLATAGAFVIGILLGAVLFSGVLTANHFSEMEMHEKRGHFIEEKNEIIGELMPESQYRCCLEKPCTYCIEKTPGHGEGATCNCLEDVVTGVHPCGECIGEIMEGHGNPFLAEYFARAIAEKMGEHHLDSLKQMMYEKYGILPEDQQDF